MRRLGALRFIGGLVLFVLIGFGLAGINFDRVSEPGFLSQETCGDLAQNDPRRFDGSCQEAAALGMHSWPPETVIGWVLLAAAFLVLYFMVVKPLLGRRDL